MFIRLDDNEIKVSVPMARQTVHNDVIWLQQDSVLQLMISCHSDITVRLEPSSTFSIMQTGKHVNNPVIWLMPRKQHVILLRLKILSIMDFWAFLCPGVGDFVW